jgi:hypothetical protein
VNAICSLQPQFPHLDASHENARIKQGPREGEAAAAESEARAINLTVKTGDGDELEMGDIGKTLRTLQEETWEKLEWYDEDVSFFVSIQTSC